MFLVVTLKKRTFLCGILLLILTFCGQEKIEIEPLDPQLIAWWAISTDSCVDIASVGFSIEPDLNVFKLEYLQGDKQCNSNWQKMVYTETIDYAYNGQFINARGKAYHYEIVDDCLIFLDELGYMSHYKKIRNGFPVVEE